MKWRWLGRCYSTTFEVFSHDWLVVITDMENRKETIIHNNIDQLRSFHQENKDNIWVGYNSNSYDRYILKALLCGFTAQEMNDWIIVKKRKGWEFSRELNKIPLLNYDAQTNKYHSLKQLEAFMGHDIRETTVPFDIDRPLTKEELEEVIFYCRHDIHETAEVFMRQIEEFQSHLGLVKEFELPLKNISNTKAQLSAKILEAYQGQEREDEFDIEFVETIRLSKYAHVKSFYESNRDYNKSLETTVAGVPHTFAWGGVHGAIDNYHGEGYFLNMDVASMYPAIMIEYGFLSRNVKNAEKFREIRDDRLIMKANKDPRQAPRKIVLNSTYGASKDKYNGLFDPRQANNVCVNGQLLLLDLIEKLESHCQIIQSNTDGVLIKLNSIADFDLIDDIAFEWEQRTRLELEFEWYKKIHQKDVNNYIVVDMDGKYKSKGAYVKKLSELDNDLPIVNQAVVNYFVHNKPVEETIYGSTSLIDFQKIVKVSGKYDYAIYGTRKQHLKVFRLFAAKSGKELRKVKGDSIQKISYTPDVCRIVNEDITDKDVPDWMDRDWYCDVAEKRISDFLGLDSFT